MEKQTSKFDSHIARARNVSRFLFEHIPTSAFGRSNYPTVNVAERTHQLIEGSFPPADYEWTRYDEEGVVTHEPPDSIQPSFWDKDGFPHYPDETQSFSKISHPALYDDMGTYFDGSDNRE